MKQLFQAYQSRLMFILDRCGSIQDKNKQKFFIYYYMKINKSLILFILSKNETNHYILRALTYVEQTYG